MQKKKKKINENEHLKRDFMKFFFEMEKKNQSNGKMMRKSTKKTKHRKRNWRKLIIKNLYDLFFLFVLSSYLPTSYFLNFFSLTFPQPFHIRFLYILSLFLSSSSLWTIRFIFVRFTRKNITFFPSVSRSNSSSKTIIFF